MPRLNPESGPVDLDHCPTCNQQWIACGAIWPPSREDVVTTRCQLPRGHRSEEHWHSPLWPGTADLLWFDPPTPDPDMIP